MIEHEEVRPIGQKILFLRDPNHEKEGYTQGFVLDNSYVVPGGSVEYRVKEYQAGLVSYRYESEIQDCR
jgi:hypothetical protein